MINACSPFRPLPPGIRGALRALCLVLLPVTMSAQTTGITVQARTDREDALYSCGEPATFLIEVRENGQAVTDATVSALITLDGGKELLRRDIELGNGTCTIAHTLDQPGFLRLQVSYRAGGKPHVAWASAGFEPTKIRTGTPEPTDFDAFWEEGRNRLAELPLDLRMRRLDKQCTDKQDVFAISFANIDKTRIYGFLRVPLGRPGPFPAWVTVPGAGPGPYGAGGKGYADQGALALTMGVHAYDVGTLTREEIKAAYAALNQERRYPHQGAPDREAYYFRRTYLGIDRAIRWLTGRPDFDGEHLVIDGSSQGGGSALILAGMNRSITAAAANVPALCDHGGYLADRSPGWPKLVQGENDAEKARFLTMAAYFDVVNFARRIDCPVIVSAGFIDRTCSPSSVYAAFNVISSPKRIFNGPLNGHEMRVGGYRPFVGPWVEGQLGLRDPVAPTAP